MIVTSTSIMIAGRSSLRIVRPARSSQSALVWHCVLRRNCCPANMAVTPAYGRRTGGSCVCADRGRWPISRIPQLCAGRGQRSERHLHLFHARAIAGCDGFFAGRLGRRRCAARRFHDPADASTHSRWCRAAGSALSLMAGPLCGCQGVCRGRSWLDEM